MKTLVKKIFASVNIYLIFPSERSLQGLRPFVIEFFQRQSKGVLHIGGSTGQEAEDYFRQGLPVIWVEADPLTFATLEKRIKKFPNQRALNYLVSDAEREMEFFVTDNSGLSSSVYPLSAYGQDFWNIKNVESKKLFSRTIDSLLEVDLSAYDFWVIDVQGHELEVLKGAENALKTCNWILCEISTIPYYENQHLYHEICDWLLERDFCPLYKPSANHCEVLYARR